MNWLFHSLSFYLLVCQWFFIVVENQLDNFNLYFIYVFIYI